ncbi:RNA polymerase [Paracoccus phage ParMal1]|uniref:DNA-directed RNA polymerase n=1 Tax=Paracoccus phage ParMal1 TaxID=3032416 RepID=A0AAF0FL10_9CAUD|nr:RNA polymerase [Paracoccus phage ParMal1]
MPDISEQKKWERDMTALGVSRFRAQEQKAKDGERFTETSAGARLLRVYLSQVSAEIAVMFDKIGNRATKKRMYAKLLKGIDYDKLAMFTLYRIIECVYKPATLTRVAASIGQMVEDELRFSQFEIELPEYYNAVIRDLDSRQSVQYRHRHRVLVSTMNEKGVEWNSWTNDTHIQVGLLLLSAAEASSDLVQRGFRGQNVIIEPTQEVIDWITAHDDSIEIMMPDRMPCIIEPNDWTDWKDGGFYSNRLRGLTPMVKTRSGQQRDTQSPLLDSAAMPTVFESVNAMQNTSWAINRDILAVVREVWERGLEIGMPRSQPYEIPPAPLGENQKPGDLTGVDKLKFDEWKAEARTLHGLESERKASLMSVVRAMRMASRMEHLDLLWMVYQLDFRSRTYTTTSGVSPQGSDVSKALLHFGVEKELGERGWYWFRVHGANKYGNDKGHYDTRVSWVNDNFDALIAAGLDPLSHTEVWKDADKPFQFLAWCMEYSRACRSGDPTKFRSRIPVALDGSCNGLQHFSAMLRDPVGGKSVNLTPGEVPSDIYQDVADVATERLKEILADPAHDHYAVAANWMGLFKKLTNGKMGRKLAKKPVMTLPYGSTLQTCTQSVYGWYLEQREDFFPKNTAFAHSIFMAKVLWDSIGKVVVAARAAMDWLQKCARMLAKEDHPLIYTSPVGFPMVQFAPNFEKMRVETQIGGRLQLQILREVPGVNMYKASSGSSPNLVHTIDAAHMHMVVAEGARRGFTHFAMIHDDFGVHACHIDEWHEIIREQFIKLHTEHNVLQEFKDQQESRTGVELPPVPDRGDLEICEVSKSLFFFG